MCVIYIIFNFIYYKKYLYLVLLRAFVKLKNRHILEEKSSINMANYIVLILQLNLIVLKLYILEEYFFYRSTEEATTTAYFTHSGTILKLLALLGVAKDTHPLMHNSFVLHQDNRAWRSSIIDVFASNMAFILYKYFYFHIIQNYVIYFLIDIIFSLHSF